MTQEDKELLLKDICARLPYKVKVCLYKKETCILIGIDGDEVYLDVDSDSFYMENIKPYLRPIHKLTKEELEELEFLTDSDYVDYCNKHHIDYRNLIPKGLALEAPEGMYK